MVHKGACHSVLRNYCGVIANFLFNHIAVFKQYNAHPTKQVFTPGLQAVGASIRVFDLLDRSPLVSNEGGQIFISLEAG